VGKGLVENVIWGEGLAENVKIPSYGRRKSKIAQKNRHMIFERSLAGKLSTLPLHILSSWLQTNSIKKGFVLN